MRKDWDEYFMSLAFEVATRSTCLRRQVGAVAVNDRHIIIGTGYNGAPRHMTHCTKDTCIRILKKIPSGEKLEICKAVHAEQNLVTYLGEKLKDATVYITTRPCTTCAKLLIQAGVKEIIWKHNYDDPYSSSLLTEYYSSGLVSDIHGFTHVKRL